jgi:hypothetical protein
MISLVSASISSYEAIFNQPLAIRSAALARATLPYILVFDAKVEKIDIQLSKRRAAYVRAESEELDTGVRLCRLKRVGYGTLLTRRGALAASCIQQRYSLSLATPNHLI